MIVHKEMDAIKAIVVILMKLGFVTDQIVNPSKYELLEYLLDRTRYDASIFPGYFTGNHSLVTVQIAITKIGPVNEMQMAVDMMLFLRMNWEDVRLNYHENATYDKLEITGDRVNRVWTPDIYFDKEKKIRTLQLTETEKLVYIKPFGQVYYSERITMTFYCDMDLTWYPKDNQNCRLTVQSYAFTSDEMLLRWNDESSVNNLGGNFSCLTFSVMLERRGKNAFTLIGPYSFFLFVAFAAFGVNKIEVQVEASTLAMTSMVVQWVATYSALPSQENGMVLDFWITCHILSVFIILLVQIRQYWLGSLNTEEEGHQADRITNVREYVVRIAIITLIISIYFFVVNIFLGVWGFSGYWWFSLVILPFVFLNLCYMVRRKTKSTSSAPHLFANRNLD